MTLGRDATVEVPNGVVMRNWDTDEPSERGVDGDRADALVSDNINARASKP